MLIEVLEIKKTNAKNTHIHFLTFLFIKISLNSYGFAVFAPDFSERV